MSKVKTEFVKIADLKMNLFVRQALNQDHALLLADLIDGGTKLPPIKITRDRVVIDGRHRVEAHELNKLKEIEVEVVDIETESEMIAVAFKANSGGALPPTQEDIEHTVMLLLGHGESIKGIAALLNLPMGMTRKFVNTIQSKATRLKLLKAVTAVSDGGLTVAKAAELHEVSPDKLKEALSGRRRTPKNGVGEMHVLLTGLYKSLGLKKAALGRSLRLKLEDGDVSEKQVREILAHIEQLDRQAARTTHDQKKRFDFMSDRLAQVS